MLHLEGRALLCNQRPRLCCKWGQDGRCEDVWYAGHAGLVPGGQDVTQQAGGCRAHRFKHLLNELGPIKAPNGCAVGVLHVAELRLVAHALELTGCVLLPPAVVAVYVVIYCKGHVLLANEADHG
jgi:hypothetical protein